MTASAQSIPTTNDLRAGLKAAIDSKQAELTALQNALGWLNTAAPAAAAKEEQPQRQASKKPGRKIRAERTPTKSKKASARSKTTTRRALEDDDTPRARKGHVPKKGVEQLYCADLAERQEKTSQLKGEGYRRIGPGEPLTTGTYDVRPSGDEDDSCVVLWRAKAEVDGE